MYITDKLDDYHSFKNLFTGSIITTIASTQTEAIMVMKQSEIHIALINCCPNDAPSIQISNIIKDFPQTFFYVLSNQELLNQFDHLENLENYLGFIAKPINPLDLKMHIKNAIQIYRLQKINNSQSAEITDLKNINETQQYKILSEYRKRKKMERFAAENNSKQFFDEQTKILQENESKFRNLINGLNDIVFRVSLPDGKYEYISPAVRNIFGYVEEDFYNNKFFINKIIHPDYKSTFEGKTTELLNGELLPNIEFKIIDAKGDEKWIVQSIHGIYEDGQLMAIEGISRDITDWKNTERALKDSELKYRTLIDNIPQKVFYKNKNSIYLAVNPNFASTFDATPSQFVNKSDYDFLPKEVADIQREEDLRIMNSGKIEEKEETFIEGGKQRVHNTIKCPVRDANNNVIGILGIFWDITERKKVEEKLRRAVKEVMIANEEVIVTNIQLEQQKNEITKQRDEIENHHQILQEQKQELTDSIIYAQRIQNAVLSPVSIMNDVFGENFILYLPRDIVSGDFYWFRRTDKYFLIASADCTGHGVPGAFMSMLGITFINEITGALERPTPDAILEMLRNRIKDTLRHDDDIRVSSDGLDIALCELNLETNEMLFAGANSPIYILRNNPNAENQAVEEHKSDIQPIGKGYKERPFKMDSIQLYKGDLVYMLSDGYKDQFGGVHNKRFTSAKFKQILSGLRSISLSDQKQILYNEYLTWKGDTEQIDDILVLGFKIP